MLCRPFQTSLLPKNMVKIRESPGSSWFLCWCSYDCPHLLPALHACCLSISTAAAKWGAEQTCYNLYGCFQGAASICCGVFAASFNKNKPRESSPIQELECLEQCVQGMCRLTSRPWEPPAHECSPLHVPHQHAITSQDHDPMQTRVLRGMQSESEAIPAFRRTKVQCLV